MAFVLGPAHGPPRVAYLIELELELPNQRPKTSNARFRKINRPASPQPPQTSHLSATVPPYHRSLPPAMAPPPPDKKDSPFCAGQTKRGTRCNRHVATLYCCEHDPARPKDAAARATPTPSPTKRKRFSTATANANANVNANANANAEVEQQPGNDDDDDDVFADKDKHNSSPRKKHNRDNNKAIVAEWAAAEDGSWARVDRGARLESSVGVPQQAAVDVGVVSSVFPQQPLLMTNQNQSWPTTMLLEPEPEPETETPLSAYLAAAAAAAVAEEQTDGGLGLGLGLGLDEFGGGGGAAGGCGWPDGHGQLDASASASAPASAGEMLLEQAGMEEVDDLFLPAYMTMEEIVELWTNSLWW